MLEMDVNNPKIDQPLMAERPYRVGIVPMAGFALMSYACTVEPLRAANLLSGSPLYDIQYISDTQVTASSGNSKVERTMDFDGAGALDLVLVVAGGDPFAQENAALSRWLQRLAQHNVLMGGVSGGPVHLAQAGVMAGRRMTVHWEHAPELAERFPDLIIERRLYIKDRDRITCGGGTAPLDLMHALIASHHGHTFAQLVNDWFLHTEVRAAAAPQRAGLFARVGAGSPPLHAAAAAMEDHVADPLTLPQLSLIAGVTPRHMNRLFRQSVGESTMAYYRGIRLGVGRRLITGSTLSIAAVAEATGFASGSHFSGAYLKQFGVRPMRDRRQPDANG